MHTKHQTKQKQSILEKQNSQDYLSQVSAPPQEKKTNRTTLT